MRRPPRVEQKTSRRCRAPLASGSDRSADGGRSGGKDDRLEAVEAGEGARPRLLGEEQGGATAGVANADGSLETECIDGGEHVESPKPDQAKSRSSRHTRLAVAAKVRGEAVETVPRLRCQGPEHRP